MRVSILFAASCPKTGSGQLNLVKPPSSSVRYSLHRTCSTGRDNKVGWWFKVFLGNSRPATGHDTRQKHRVSKNQDGPNRVPRPKRRD